MRPCASAGIASETDRIACLYSLVGLHEVTVKVTVNSLESVGVAYNDVVAVSFSLIISETHLAVESGIDSVIGADTDIHTLVHSSETGTVAVIGSDFAFMRHCVTGNVDHLGRGDVSFLKGVYAFAVPSFSKDINFRLKVVVEVYI